MKKAKKLLVTLLILTFVLSTVSVGFAASFSDVKDNKVADAVTRLAALDILNGYPDGTFKPDNPITRAEFAKIIVSAVGVGSAAEYAKGTTQFKDVPADYWASGYIKVASDMKIVNGRGNGVFDPGANVTYAEAITMIVRALGYEPKAQALGGYPGGYLAIAAEKEITKGVNVVNTLAATRGDIAKMVDNSLDVKLMEQTSFGSETSYEEVDKTLLDNKLNVTKYKEATIIDIPRFDSGLKANEIKISYKDGDSEKNKTLDVVDGLNIDALYGITGDVYVNDDDEIFFVSQSEDINVYYDQIDKNGPDSDEAGCIDDDQITLVKQDDDFDLAKDEDGDLDFVAKAYDDTTVTTLDTEKKLEDFVDANGTVWGKFVTNTDGDIQYMELYTWNENEAGVVTNVDTKNEIITVFNDSEDEEEIDLTDEDGYKIFDASFNSLTLSDIQKNDVVYVQKLEDKESGDTLFYVFVSSAETLKGTLESYDEEDQEVDVSGETYDIADNATISLDDNDSISNDNFYSDLDDALDEEATIIFDITGKVRHICTSAEASSDDLYGIITGTKTDFDDEYVKIYNQDGKEITYMLDLDTDNDNYDEDYDSVSGEISKFDIVKYTLNSDGNIDSIVNLGNVDNAADFAEVAVDGFDDDSIETDKVYDVGSDIPIFDLKDYISSKDTDDINIVKWADISGKDVADNSVYVLLDTNNKGTVKAAFFSKGIDTVGDDEQVGYAITVKRTSDGDKVKIDIYGQGVKEYIAKDDGAFTKEEIYLFTINSSNKLVKKTPGSGDYTDYTVVESVYVADKDGDYIKLTKGATDYGWLKIDSNTVIYDTDDVKDKYDIHKGDTLEKVLFKNKILKAIKID